MNWYSVTFAGFSQKIVVLAPDPWEAARKAERQARALSGEDLKVFSVACVILQHTDVADAQGRK